jgi:hypothetical protein
MASRQAVVSKVADTETVEDQLMSGADVQVVSAIAER